MGYPRDILWVSLFNKCSMDIPKIRNLSKESCFQMCAPSAMEGQISGAKVSAGPAAAGLVGRNS